MSKKTGSSRTGSQEPKTDPKNNRFLKNRVGYFKTRRVGTGSYFGSKNRVGSVPGSVPDKKTRKKTEKNSVNIDQEPGNTRVG